MTLDLITTSFSNIVYMKGTEQILSNLKQYAKAYIIDGKVYVELTDYINSLYRNDFFIETITITKDDKIKVQFLKNNITMEEILGIGNLMHYPLVQSIELSDQNLLTVTYWKGTK